MKNLEDKISSFSYSANEVLEVPHSNADEIKLSQPKLNTWLNIYGLDNKTEFSEIIKNNSLDDFIKLLIQENTHRNKTIELEENIFLAINTIHLKRNKITTEQMLFVVSPNYVWSIQEKHGDYFGEIRFRLRENKGIVRKKNADYLLYLIIDAIIDNYANVYETINKKIGRIKDLASANLDESYVMKIEGFKQQLFQLKKAVSSLREAIFKLENCELEGFDTRYFSESKEQAHFLIDDIDFDLVQLESNLNLVFNLQNNRLNQVMKTLTIFSVIFIPLTFLAGIYGMNFDYIPETKSQYGYFILLGVMLVITLLTLFMIKKRNWFK